ncbi:MAG TPA: DinB family protein [Deinococcales bacterium]|nr:DinB family protein [Deinococcales bacterium]
MHPRVQELLRHLDECRADLLAAVQDVPLHLRERRPGPGRWSAAEVVEHVALTERRIAVALARQLRAATAAGLRREGDGSPLPSAAGMARVLDRGRRLVTPEAGEPSGLSVGEALAAFEEAQAALRAAFVAGDGLALGEVSFPHPVLGPLDVYQWVDFVGWHERRHAAQVREVAAQLAASGAA